MTFKYMTRWEEITPVEVERETDNFVIIRGRREAKRSDWQNYWDTREEAIAYILERQRNAVSAAQKRLDFERVKLVNLESKYLP